MHCAAFTRTSRCAVHCDLAPLPRRDRWGNSHTGAAHCDFHMSALKLTRSQVVRYGALISGIGYGILHRRTLQRKQDAEHAKHEATKQERWIAEANEAWRKKQESPLAQASAGASNLGPSFPVVIRARLTLRAVGSAVEELERLLKQGVSGK